MLSRDGCVYLITGKHSFILWTKTDPAPTKTDYIFMDQLETLIRLRSRLRIHFKTFKHLNSINYTKSLRVSRKSANSHYLGQCGVI